MRKGDRVFSIFGMGLSLWLILEALQFDYLSEFGPGPGFEPFWLGIFLSILSIFLFVNTFRRRGDKEYEKPRLPGWKSLGRIGIILLLIAGFALSFNTLGLLITVFLFVALILFTLEKVGILKSIFYGIVFSGFVVLIFSYWMDINFPKGFLGI
ncbi:MAG: tripartite tricarboxylate transporter TctB family protein [Desulfobacterales bacterium]|nr:tripartite tricarboxylate transporter TctB family protein [Desulfobacterales bacterium]